MLKEFTIRATWHSGLQTAPAPSTRRDFGYGGADADGGVAASWRRRDDVTGG
jgi:hypothetical protein